VVANKIGQLLFESIRGASLKLQAPSGKLGACGNMYSFNLF
jgi:hypothetical protein